MQRHASRAYGFTLIELSIVLVIIGLIVGGVLTGRDLIKASEVRATVTQVEKYNTAANTFREKYGYLPGDVPPAAVSQFGFTTLSTRPGTAGQGDGNGALEGYSYQYSVVWDFAPMGGETVWFWEDLSSNSHLIEGNFNYAPVGSNNGATTLYLPEAKLGGGNYFYVYSFNGTNYFGLSNAVNAGASAGGGVLWGSGTSPGLTVQQAYAIDSKVDDGLPQSGNVTAKYQNWSVNASGGNSYYQYGAYWASGGGVVGPYGTAANPASSTTCYDNNNTNGATQRYSVQISNGANNNCGLSFKMQAGD